MNVFSNLLSPDAYQQLDFDFCFSFNLKDLIEILFKLFSNSSNFCTIFTVYRIGVYFCLKLKYKDRHLKFKIT